MMAGTQHSVSTLLTTVGLFQRPALVWWGGLCLGIGRPPSRALSIADPSPQM